MKNITFLLGAGASYNSCPIWKEQANKMIELARRYIQYSVNFNAPKPTSFANEYESVLWDIGYLGTKAEKFGTIDTYAKKLFLNKSNSELSRLKIAVSLFFTLWQLTDDKEFKVRNENAIGEKEYEEIDRRYIALLAAILENKSGTDIKIKNNIKFVTWNYDLQLELAFKSFYNDELSYEYAFQRLKFRVNGLPNEPLQICHLNGYHGFYNAENREISFIDVPVTKNIVEILGQIDFISAGQTRKQLDITNHINYAWESNAIANKTREEAKRIFAETDILVIIGYSFPNFNKDIDKLLFDQLNKRELTIYYQDPNANETQLIELMNSNEPRIICQKEKLDTFILPYEF